MFRSLRRSQLPTDHVFAVTIGASTKMTLASWHLLEPADVIDTVGELVGLYEPSETPANHIEIPKPEAQPPTTDGPIESPEQERSVLEAVVDAAEVVVEQQE